jgi:capsular polysaccharide biosynthesis protein
MARNDPALSPPDDLHREPIGRGDRDAIDTDAVMRFIRRRRRLCIAWLVGGLCAGIAYAVTAPAYYTASASILLEDNAARSADVPVAETDAAHSTFVETQVQVFESDEVIGRIVDEEQLAIDEEFGGPGGGLRTTLAKYVRSVLGAASPPAREPRYATIVRVRRALFVRRVGVSDVVEIQFTSRDPDRAATIANAIITSYTNSRIDLQRNAREETASHLRTVLAELRDKAFPSAPPADAFAATSPSGPDAMARFREQEDRTGAYRALYGRLLRQALGGSGGDFSAANVRVITPAESPLLASSRVMILVSLSALGGVAGIADGLCREMTDRCLRTVEDVNRTTGIDGVVALSEVKTAGWKVEANFPSYLQPAYTKIAESVYEGLSKVAVGLQHGGSRRSRLIIAVGTPTEGTGASSVASHLARIIAESGQKTLLLDANWQKPAAGQALLNSSPSRKLARGLSTLHLEAETLDILVLRAATPIS